MNRYRRTKSFPNNFSKKTSKSTLKNKSLESEHTWIKDLNKYTNCGKINNEIKDLNKFRDLYWESQIIRFDPQLEKGIRLYRFPIKKCNDLKTYKLLEENKEDEIKKILINIKNNQKNLFKHDLINKCYFKKNRKPNQSLFELDYLSVISYKLAENFANESNEFSLGPLLNTQLLEFHTYATSFEEYKEGLLDKHTDDKTGVPYKTITLIWYLIKDPEVDGGNISFFKDYDDEKGIKINIWESDFDPKKLYSKDRKKCILLMFKGNIEHQPEAIKGQGERSAIVFQFERIDKPKAGKKTKNKKTKKQKTKKQK